MNRFTNRISKWTTQARRSLETAARVLEAQDEQYEARACGGSCGSTTLEEDPSDFAVQVSALRVVSEGASACGCPGEK